MAAEVRFAPEAASDVEAGFRWYEEQRVGLGPSFSSCVPGAAATFAGATRADLGRIPSGAGETFSLRGLL